MKQTKPRRPWGPAGTRDIVNGAHGRWVEGRNGGVWFRPDNWKPKVHFHGEDTQTLCGKNLASTSNVTLVTCGTCKNMILIRRFKLIMFLIAALMWANMQPAKGGSK